MPLIETPLATLALVALAAYFLGAVPFGLLISRALGLGDLRQIGSGNIGATNVLRTGHKGAAAATLILDAAKGAAAVLIAAMLYGQDAAQIAGLAAFLGHLFPAWLGFRGGKGVATFLGVVLALAWPVGLAACATWALIAALTRISSYAALACAALAPVWCVVLDQPHLILLLTILCALIFWRHAPNIARIKAGTEPKIGGK